MVPDTQEEVRSLSDETIETLHEVGPEPRPSGTPQTPRRAFSPKSILASETLRRMEEKRASDQS